MKIHVRLFSLAKDLAGFEEQMMELGNGGVAGDIILRLARVNPGFLDWQKSLRLAVNLEYVDNAYELHEGDEVAVIPPVSGG